MRRVSRQAIKAANYKRSTASVKHVGIVTGIIVTIVVSNVLFTMVTGVHFRSGVNAKDLKDGSGVVYQDVIANRGFIYDRNKEIIAQDVESYDLFGHIDKERINATNKPVYVVDIRDTSEKLAPILGTDTATLEAIFNKGIELGQKQIEFQKLGKNLTADQKGQIEALNLPGLDFTKSTKRVYITPNFASQMIGFADYNEEDKKISGVMGLEKYYDKKLSGKDGRIVYQKDKDGNYLPNTKKYESVPVNGSDVYLTIDKDVQLSLEKALQDTMKQANTTEAWGIVMEAKTGKVLAQAGYPSFNLNERNDIPNHNNIPSESTFEVGSVMKAFVYAAAMNEGVYRGSDTFASGTAKIGLNANGQPVRDDSLSPSSPGYLGSVSDALGKSWETITFDEGLVRSANTGIVSLLSDYLSPDTNAEYMKNFGFFKPVDIEGLKEGTGKLNMEYPIDKISLGYGQSATVNSYQLIQAATALFGDGTLIKPYIIDKIVDPNTSKTTYKGKTEVLGNPITPETATQIQGLMKRVVDEEIGTAHTYQMSDISMMAKTGTGQFVIDGKYSDKIYISSILAAAPAENPEIIVYYAFKGEDIQFFERSFFKELVRQSLDSLNKYNEASQEPQSSPEEPAERFSEYPMPAVVNHSLDYAQQKLDGFNVKKHIIGDGNSIIDQYPKGNTKILSNQNLFLMTDGANIKMPNMNGWSRKDIAIFAQMVGFRVEYSGSGGCVAQSIAPDTPITAESVLSVELK